MLSAPSSASASASATSRSAPALCGGSLVFYSPGTETEAPATIATHATFSPRPAATDADADADADTGADELDLAEYVVGIQ